MAGSSRRPAPRRPEVAAAAPDQRTQAGDELRERERLRQVVVAAGREARSRSGSASRAVKNITGRVDAVRAQRLEDVAPVGVGQADVDHSASGASVAATRRSSWPRPRRDSTSNPSSAQAARQQQPQLGVVLEHDHVRSRLPLITPRAVSLRAAGAGACGSRRAARRARPGQRGRAERRRGTPTGTASVSGGGSNTCWSIATSISASSQPSPAASTTAAAEHERGLGPEERADLAQRRAERGHRRELVAALARRAEADEEPHRRRRQDDDERLLDPADPGQVDGGDRADGLRASARGCS